MDKASIEKLIEKSGPEDRARLTTLYNAAVETLRAYQGDHAAARLRDWEAAEEALARVADEVEGRLFPADPPMKNKLEAVKALQADGYKVAKSKVYADAKKGLLRVQADGSVRRSDLDSYVLRAGLERKTSSASGSDMEADQGRKLKLENEKLSRQNEKLQWELDQARGRYLLKEDVHIETALKFGLLEAELKHFVRTEAADLVYAVGGDSGKARVLINLVEARLDEVMHRIGQMEEINVQIAKRD